MHLKCKSAFEEVSTSEMRNKVSYELAHSLYNYGHALLHIECSFCLHFCICPSYEVVCAGYIQQLA